MVLKTEKCKLGHKKICNGKGHFGFKCLKCKKFTYRRNNENSETMRQVHQCGIEKCNNCGNNFNPDGYEDIHLCPIKKETVTKHWPSLAFLKIEFQHTSEHNCYNCFKKRLSYAKVNNQSLKNVFKLPKSEELICSDHLGDNYLLNPNFAMIYKENKIKRGEFSRHIIADICENLSEDNIFTFEYTKNLKTPSKFVPNKQRITGDMKNILNHLNETNFEYLTLINQVFKTIFQDHWRNTAFLLQDEDSTTLVINFIFTLKSGINYALME